MHVAAPPRRMDTRSVRSSNPRRTADPRPSGVARTLSLIPFHQARFAPAWFRNYVDGLGGSGSRGADLRAYARSAIGNPPGFYRGSLIYANSKVRSDNQDHSSLDPAYDVLDSGMKHRCVSVRSMTSRATNRRRPAAAWIWKLAVERPGTMHEAIRDELRAVILAGLARPGAPINVDDVAQRFGASRIPVREALKTLIGESLVDHEPRAGYRVAQLTRTELAELYIVRGALEAAALGAAVASATAEDDAEVAAAYQALSQAIEERDARGHHVHSRRLHLALASPCRMSRLLGMFESAWNITEPLQPMSHVSNEMTCSLHGDHRMMVDAFHVRDSKALLAASASHYRRLQEVVASLPATRLRP